jgi:uncharacterized membrane protein
VSAFLWAVLAAVAWGFAPIVEKAGLARVQPMGQTFFYNALKHGDVSRLVPVSGSYPFIAFILGVLIFGESVTPLKVLGALAIVGGVWLLKIG